MDDTPLNVELLVRFLGKMQYLAETAHNGKDALEKIMAKSKSSCCTRFNVIFMDLNMPIMSGWDAAVEIQKLVQSHTIAQSELIALTADKSEDENALKGIGFNRLMAKPISKKVFLEAVSFYLHEEHG